jgi:Ca-activated chloride channel family protein
MKTAVLLLTIAQSAGVASTVARQPVAVFHAETRLVVVQASVRNTHGALVTNLEPSAFTVYENGRPQPIRLFLGDKAPISAAIVLDNSGSMRTRRDAAETAALTFARAANRSDELFVVNFRDTATVDVPMTNDPRVLEAGIARTPSIGGTAFRDAVEVAERYLCEHATHDRKVVLAITDGEDNASAARPELIRRVAQQNNIAVYIIALPRADGSKSRASRELSALAESTGGVVLQVSDVHEAPAAAIELTNEIRHQYTFAYAPLNQTLDGSYRKIDVRVKSHERLIVRTRAGYFATSSGVGTHSAKHRGPL